MKRNVSGRPDDLSADFDQRHLFGHVKGAFTGAIKDRSGRFELADGGTLFLDEVGEIPVALQSKLLRVLQEGTYERIGDEKTLKTDVRIIAATNQNLKEEVEAKRFRQDLYYRLNVFPIEVPPLRSRPEDIPGLASHFLKLAAGDPFQLAIDQRHQGIQGFGITRGVALQERGNGGRICLRHRL